MNTTRIVAPGPNSRSVCTQEGQVIDVPADWQLLPPGDATLTRRVKAAGDHWTVQQKKGRRSFSLGVWAPAQCIAKIRSQLEAERETAEYAQRRAAGKERRDRKQQEYVAEFHQAVLDFLNFASEYTDLANCVAASVTQHATPIGSGTVARTQRIPIQRRAESAVIAWLRHQTTAYDDMKIPRIRGKRREVRQQLAEASRRLLDRYRKGGRSDSPCVLQQAVDHFEAERNR